MNSLTGQWIGDAGILRKVVRELRQEPVLAVDLEADSLFHYQEKICLIQLATQDRIFLVDPLAITGEIRFLKPVFSDPDIRKIFHGSDYDIRSLHRDFGIEVVNLFDTEVACRFLGMKYSGLDTVLQDRFQITLDKRFQKKDWSRRPLPDEMQEYAARDVAFLIPLAESLNTDLHSMGRMGWFEEECQALSRVRYAEVSTEPRFVKMKGAGKLRPRSLAVLESLMEFREEAAHKKDRPPFKIMSNAVLLDISKTLPTDLESLHRLHILSARQLGMYGQDLIDRVNVALGIPEDQLPGFPRYSETIPENGYTLSLRALKEARIRWSNSLSMDPGFICSNALLYRIAVLAPTTLEELSAVPGIKSWQAKVFGKEILQVIQRTCWEGKRGSGSKNKVHRPHQA